MPKMLIEIDTDTQVVVPRVTSVSSEMKAKFIGEFSWSESLEDYDNAIIEYIVPWWVCKEIFHRMAQHWISAATQPAPIPTAWQPIETAPTDVLHVRGLWVYDDSGQPLSFDCDTGRIDDDGFFVDEFGNVHGWSADDYTHWHPLAIPPAPGGSDE